MENMGKIIKIRIKKKKKKTLLNMLQDLPILIMIFLVKD